MVDSEHSKTTISLSELVLEHNKKCRYAKIRPFLIILKLKRYVNIKLKSWLL